MEYLDNLVTRMAQKCVPVSPSGTPGQDEGPYVGPIGPGEDIVAGAYYVAPSGSDSNLGTSTSPFATLEKAWSVISAGDTVYVRGGTYSPIATIYFEDKSGTLGNEIDILNYPGESPVFDFGSQTYLSQVFGIRIDNVDYLHMRGIRVTNVWTDGNYAMYGLILWNDVNNSTFERIETDNIHGWGVTIGDNCNTITFLNCDSHHNSDPNSGEPYGWSDGFQCGSASSTNITFRGCRAWWNSDDGWDLRLSNGNFTLDGCWSFWNGYVPDTFTPAGNGEGFKLGPKQTADSATNLRTVFNCLAFENYSAGFALLMDPGYYWFYSTIYNNTAYGNARVFGGAGFMFEDGEFVSTMRNNLDYYNGISPVIAVAHDDTYNSWNLAVTVSNADFTSVVSTGSDGARNSAGDLPTLSFMHLSPSSDLINAGTDIGYGNDLGCFQS